MRRAAWLPLLLVLITAGRHQLVDVLALLYAEPARARRALFYAAGGISCATLYAVVWYLAHGLPRFVAIPARLACAWGILEEGQVAACRFAAGIGQPAHAPMWRGICDAMAGLPLSTMTLVLPVVLAYWIFSSRGNNDG